MLDGRGTPALLQDQPRYVAVAKSLAEQIASGRIASGDRLVGERQLCRRFEVSRVTIRRALLELRERGLVEANSTRGWFVTGAALGEPNALVSFTEMARGRGLAPSSRVVQARVRAAAIDEAEELRIAPGTALFDVERVRRLDGVAVALEHCRIPLTLAPSLPKADLATGSLYETLRQAGVVPASADYVLQAIAAEPRHAKLLRVAAGAPLLMTTARSFDGKGRPIELSRSVFRGDRYRFRTTLFRTEKP
jgi:DNA-binding GntR family transcriptional regulator